METSINYAVSPTLMDTNTTKWPDFERLVKNKTQLSLTLKQFPNSKHLKSNWVMVSSVWFMPTRFMRPYYSEAMDTGRLPGQWVNIMSHL